MRYWSRAQRKRTQMCVRQAQNVPVHASSALTNLKLVLTYNRNDSDAKRGNKLVRMKSGELTMELAREAAMKAMKTVQGYRAMGLICRQRAVFDPEHSWKHLADAERWDHLAYAEIASHFRDCNAASAGNAASHATSVANDTRPETTAAA